MEITEKKICSKCKVEKDVGEFCRRRYSNGNVVPRSYCKDCWGVYKKQYRQSNKQKLKDIDKQYHQSNRKNILERQKQYYQNNKEQRKQYRQNNIEKRLLNGARRRAIQKNREFNLTTDDIILPEYCPILGIKLTISEKTFSRNSYSLDRIDNNKGYIKGNVQVISFRANTIKGDATLEELKKIVEWMEKHQKQEEEGSCRR